MRKRQKDLLKQMSTVGQESNDSREALHVPGHCNFGRRLSGIIDNEKS